MQFAVKVLFINILLKKKHISVLLNRVCALTKPLGSWLIWHACWCTQQLANHSLPNPKLMEQYNTSKAAVLLSNVDNLFYFFYKLSMKSMTARQLAQSNPPFKSSVKWSSCWQEKYLPYFMGRKSSGNNCLPVCAAMCISMEE